MNYCKVLLRVSALIVLLVGATTAQSSTDYPNRVVHLVVPFSPGGAADAIARPLAAELSKKLGQTVIVENRPGANSTLGTRHVARAPADGYTLLFGADAGLSLAPNTQPNLSYDAIRDFVPVALIALANQVLVVNSQSNIHSVQDLARTARAKGGTLTYASYGVGSLAHISMEVLAKRMNVKMIHVPYQGVAPALNDLIAGHVDVMFASAAAPWPQIQAGRITPIGFAGPKRSPLMPSVPTIEEQGYPGFHALGWSFIVAPKGTPPEVVTKLQSALALIAQDPSFQKNVIDANGYETPQVRTEDLSDFLITERTKSKAIFDQIRSRLK